MCKQEDYEVSLDNLALSTVASLLAALAIVSNPKDLWWLHRA